MKKIEPIPDDIVSGDECENCSHVFYTEEDSGFSNSEDQN